MTIHDALRERALDITPLTALIGQRVYPAKLTQGERRPSVVFQCFRAGQGQHLRGPVGIQETRLQADVYVDEASSDDPFSDANAIMEALYGDGLGPTASGLFGFVGDLGGSPATLRILNVADVLTRGPLSDQDNEVVRVRLQQDFLVHWKAL